MDEQSRSERANYIQDVRKHNDSHSMDTLAPDAREESCMSTVSSCVGSDRAIPTTKAEDTSRRYPECNTYPLSRLQGDATVERIGCKLKLLEIVFESDQKSKL